MRYTPAESVTAVRTFSMRAGLDASTVTPGITAPLVSFTWPPMALPLCAAARAGSIINAPRPATTRNQRNFPLMHILQ